MVRIDKACDALGPYALLGINQAAVEVKQHCMDLETAHPVARLLDLDVFDAQGRQIDRSGLSLPPRPCLVCSQPALECIRLQRHSYPELVEKAHELLSYFRN
jgi:holo-ACP synthase CitX